MTARPEDHDYDFDALPLRERFPEYLGAFGVGLVAAIVIAFVATLFGATFWGSFSNILVIYTGVLFLSGGASGGGYKNLGMAGVDRMRGRGNRGKGPSERLKAGLKPEKNPKAFWQVVGGAGYFAIALLILVLV